MVVTVIVTGIPHNVTVEDLAFNLDEIFDTNDIGTFRIHILEPESGSRHKRQVALDFDSGFDAMAAQEKIDKFELVLENGTVCNLSARISTELNKRIASNTSTSIEHVPRRRSPYLDVSRAFLPKFYTENDLIETSFKLDSHLHLLEKQKRVLKTQRQLIKEKKKLKKEAAKYNNNEEDASSSSDSSSTDSSERLRKRKKKHKKKHKKHKHHSRSPHGSRHKSRVRSKSKKRSRSMSISEDLHAPGPSKRHIHSPPMRHGYSPPMRHDRSNDPKSYDQNTPKGRDHSPPKRHDMSKHRSRSPTRIKSPTRPRSRSRSHLNTCRKIMPFIGSPQGSVCRKRSRSPRKRSKSPQSRPKNSRNRSRSPRRRRPSQHTYNDYLSLYDYKRPTDTRKRQVATETQETVTILRQDVGQRQTEHENNSILRGTNLVPDKAANKREDPVIKIKFEEVCKDLLVETASRLASNHVINPTTANIIFDELKKKIQLRLEHAVTFGKGSEITTREIVSNYRVIYTQESDDLLIRNVMKTLKLTPPEMAINNPSIPGVTINQTDGILSKSTKMPIQKIIREEACKVLLSEMKIDLTMNEIFKDHLTITNKELVLKELKKRLNIRFDGLWKDELVTVNELINLYREYYSKNTDDILFENVMVSLGIMKYEEVVKERAPVNVSPDMTEVLSQVDDLLQNIRNEVELEPQEKKIPDNPRFILPVKKITKQMKNHLNDIDLENEKIYGQFDNLMKHVLRNRLLLVLKGKDYMPTADIVKTYRERYSLDKDKSFINNIYEGLKDGKYFTDDNGQWVLESDVIDIEVDPQCTTEVTSNDQTGHNQTSQTQARTDEQKEKNNFNNKENEFQDSEKKQDNTANSENIRSENTNKTTQEETKILDETKCVESYMQKTKIIQQSELKEVNTGETTNTPTQFKETGGPGILEYWSNWVPVEIKVKESNLIQQSKELELREANNIQEIKILKEIKVGQAKRDEAKDVYTPDLDDNLGLNDSIQSETIESITKFVSMSYDGQNS